MGSIIQFGLALHNTSSENTNLDKALTERWQEWRQKERRPGGAGRSGRVGDDSPAIRR
jgi:hypothetical protein